jgi:PAS domain S-box-containing protein
MVMKATGKAVGWALLPLLLLTPLLVWQGYHFINRLRDGERSRTQQTVDLHAEAAQRAFDRIGARLDSLTAFVASQLAQGGNIDPAQFDTFAAGLHAGAKWIRAFQVVSNGIIMRTYPLEGNEAVVGYNLLADPRPVLGEDVLRAERTGRVTITGPIALVQGGLGIMVRQPVPAASHAPGCLAAVILNIAPLLAEAGMDQDAIDDVRFALRKESGEVFFGSPTVFGQQPVTHRIALPDGAWEMAACPVEGWQAANGAPVRLFYAAGFTVIFLLSALAFLLARRQMNLSQTVQAQTEALRGELAARQHAQEQFHLIMENLTDMVAMLDLDGHRLYNSPSYRKILGDPAQLVGTSSFNEIHPDDRLRVRQAFEDTVRTGVGHRLQYRLVDCTGTARHIESQGSVIRDEHGQVAKVVLVSRDVTERQRTEEILQENEARYRFLFEHNPIPMLIYERANLQMLAVNEAFQRHYGYTEAEALALRLTDLYPDDQKEKIAALIPHLHGHADVGEWRHRKRDGSFITIMVSSHDLVYDGRAARVAVMADVTARRQAEEEIRRLHDDLRQHAGELELRVAMRTTELVEARDRAESADHTKSAFLATMSHELRTPLNSIIGFTGIILQGLAGPLNAEQRKQLEMVRNSARHLLVLINDVLDISKIEAGQIEIAPAAFDVRDAIETVRHSVTPLADKKHLALITRFLIDDPIIASDRRRVEQVLLNLLSNAIKFTEQGAVTLTAESTPGTVRLTVSDTGIGIKPEDLDKLFQPFRQLDTGLTRQHEGTGLGLAICKRLVERLGGSISVASRWGQGSQFEVKLPVNLESHHEKDHSPH